MAIVSKATDYINLKKRVKTEVLRRKVTGSVESYGGVEYDYTVVPAVGNNVLIEHYNKINEPARAINSEGLLADVKPLDDIRELTILDAKIATFEAIYMTSSNTGCATSCTGLCSTTCSGSCSGGCSGCGGSCSRGCSGCTNKCTGATYIP